MNQVAGLSELVGRLEGLNLLRPDPKLINRNRVKAVQGSLAIEGNTCTVDQVTALLEHQRVLGPKQDILEVQNALLAYRALPDFIPFSVESLLEAHRLMMEGLIPEPGRFRQVRVGVNITERIFREAPSWEQVAALMDELFVFLRDSEEHWLVRSSRFHFLFVHIHPFADGNGRLARLWQNRLLMEFHPLFEFLDIESMIFEERQEYYRRIREAQDRKNCSGFIGFMLEMIGESLRELLEQAPVSAAGPDERLERAAMEFGTRPFQRKEYMRLLKTVSAPTASRDLQHGVVSGMLTKTGDKRNTVYTFRV